MPSVNTILKGVAMTQVHRSAARWFSALCGAALALPAAAQVLEDVVVTAQKREQNVQDVGIAIAAFTGRTEHPVLDPRGYPE